MADNPLSSLIQLCLLTLLILAILVIIYMVINHKLVASQSQDISNLLKENSNLLQENKELREKLARSEQSEPEWIKHLGWRLFDDAPSDPRMSALN